MCMELTAIGVVRSPLTDLALAPKQGDEGAPDALITLEAEVLPALEGISAGDHVLVLTWLDRADRSTLTVHPRGDTTRPLAGVFATRSPHRPNPIGLHLVEVLAIKGSDIEVRDLEALDGTPVVDIKPVLSEHRNER